MRHDRDRDANLRDVIGRLYEAATAPEGWTEALDRLHEVFDAAAVHLFVWNHALAKPIASVASSTYLGRKEALDYYLGIDPRRQLIARRPVGATLLCHHYFDDAFVSKSEFFQDYSLRVGRRYVMTTNLAKAGDNVSNLAVLRSPRQEPFEPESRALLEHVRPDLQRIALIHQRFHQARQEIEATRALLDAVTSSVIAVDRTAQITRMNRAAEALLASCDCLRIVGGRLAAPTRSRTEKLHQLIRRSMSTAAGAEAAAQIGDGMIVEGRSGERYGVIVARLGRRALPLEKPDLALVRIKRLGQYAGSTRHLIDMFGLTRSEAELAAAMAAGKRLDAVAKERGVRISTLRTQLRAIYGKTETSRQAELIHLIANLS